MAVDVVCSIWLCLGPLDTSKWWPGVRRRFPCTILGPCRLCGIAALQTSHRAFQWSPRNHARSLRTSLCTCRCAGGYGTYGEGIANRLFLPPPTSPSFSCLPPHSARFPLTSICMNKKGPYCKIPRTLSPDIFLYTCSASARERGASHADVSFIFPRHSAHVFVLSPCLPQR